MNKTYIGIDNGVTGSISIINRKGIASYFKTPTKEEQSYTKAKQNIRRVDYFKLYTTLNTVDDCFCLIERPMVNPHRWKASMSAIRCLEATLIAIEECGIPFQYIDSKEWQRFFLPKETIKNGGAELKKVALQIAKRIFPNITTKDADSLLIAEYARRKGY